MSTICWDIDMAYGTATVTHSGYIFLNSTFSGFLVHYVARCTQRFGFTAIFIMNQIGGRGEEGMSFP